MRLVKRLVKDRNDQGKSPQLNDPRDTTRGRVHGNRCGSLGRGVGKTHWRDPEVEESERGVGSFQDGPAHGPDRRRCRDEIVSL